jgi:preprotein translocase subunit SecE
VNNYYIKLAVTVALVGGAFGIAWRKGYLLRMRNYVLETREELRKCTWPSWNELKGSTVVVMVSIFILGLFTMGIDFVLAAFVRWMTQI